MKINSSKNASALFESERKGLTLLSQTKTIRIPEIVHYSEVNNSAFLLLEYIEQGISTPLFWKELGYQLASLHRNTNDFFGLDSNNFIGTLPQQNNLSDNWIDFFINERIQPQIDLAIIQRKIDSQTIFKFYTLFKILPNIFPEEQPALIHGDLWNGNFLCDQNSKPVLFDPSVSYGHREMDLAMSQLFGGFDKLFYQSYDEAFQIHEGFDQRVEIYQLYYLMVHVNLFGGGYLNTVKNILSRFLD